MINYTLQVLVFQVLFLAVYDVFLQKETFFKWNRIYLLITPFLSFLIPFIKFKSIQQTVPQEYVVKLPTVFLNPQVIIEQHITNKTTINYLPYIFISGVLLFAIIFLLKLFKIQKLISKNKVVKYHKYKLVMLTGKQAAFSFFNYIFIHEKLKDNKELDIIQHEIIHCKQKHTLDLLLFELLKIVMWFNPFTYMYQNRITLLHEYISDAEVVKETSKKSYFNSILSETFNVENITFINQFFKHSLIKKRIIMITKEKSQKMKQLKYLLILPILAGMLLYSSCTNEEKDELLEMENVLDSGDETTDGKYLDLETGKTFIGTSLEGKIVPLNEYTEKEIELYKKTESAQNSFIKFSVVIDKNGERVHFMKMTKNAEKYRVEREYLKGEDVPFAIIEEVPIFPGCEGTKEELRACLQEKITEHVNTNFNSKMANGLGLKSGIKRIFVMFKIDKEGNITDVKARAPHKALQEEAIRVINSIPKMKPGSYLGESVGVKYSLPIAFKVE